VVSSAPTILQPQVQIPSTASMLFSIFILENVTRKRPNKQKESGIGSFKKTPKE